MRERPDAMGELSPVHWAIVIGVLVLVFGSKRLPEAARAVGQSLRVLRAETSALHEPTPVVREHGTEESDAVADRTVAAPGVDRARGGDGGVPGAGAADDQHQPVGDR
jgi:sec-independent protein translocase protein TatA